MTTTPIQFLKHGAYWIGRHPKRSAWCAGMLLGLALPPLYALPMLFVSGWMLACAVQAESSSRMVWRGWWYGMGYYSVGLYWLYAPLSLDIHQFAWLIPIAVLGVPALLAWTCVPVAVLLGRFRHARALHRWGAWVGCAMAWATLEWIRSWIATGFPWNPLGSVWASIPLMLQLLAWIPPEILSGWTCAMAIAPAWFGRRRGILVACTMLCIQAGIGLMRLSHAEPSAAHGLRVRIVQGNIPQTLKWDQDHRADGIRTHLELSTQPSTFADGAPPHVILWPETAIPYGVHPHTPWLRDVYEALPPDTWLWTGVMRIDPAHPDTAWNSIVALHPTRGWHLSYDKHHLVPFGEYLPLRAYAPPLPWVEQTADLAPGSGPRTWHMDGMPPAGLMICYEAIFSRHVVDAADRPAWLVHATNDGWFGSTSAPYQHLAAAQMRAVEERVPVVRAANTGISAVIDRYGRIVASLPLHTQGILDHVVP